MFQGPMAAQARQMLNDPNFRRMMTDPEMMRNMSNMRRTMPGLFGGMRGMGGQPGEGNQAFPMPGNAEGGETAADTQRNPETQEGQTNTSQPPYNSFSPFDNAGAGGAAVRGDRQPLRLVARVRRHIGPAGPRHGPDGYYDG